MKNFNKNINGVTLVSLIITIIVLIILASIGTYSGVEVIKSSKFTKFTTEMKIMQTQVNKLYEQYKNGDDEVLNLGKEININQTVKDQADTVFTSEASGITDQVGFRYFDQDTIKGLNIEGVEEEFFINIEKRSVVSYEGIKYDGVTYYTLEQLPNGLYNVEYKENTNKPAFETNVEEIGDNKWRVSISKSDIKYEGYIDKWKVKYKLEGQEYWNTSDELGFVLNQSGKYLIKIANENVESEEKIITIYGKSLPNGYQLVEYIESTGTQYIDTGIIGTQDIIIDTTFSWTKYLSRWNYFFNAMAQSSDGYWYGIGQASGNRNTRVNMGGTGGLSNITSYTDVPYNDFTKHHYFIKEFSITVDESNTYEIQSKGDFSTVYPIAIFANNKVGAITEYSCARLYTFTMYNKDNIIRNFIPCYKKDSGEIGLYDLVEGKFYTNKGTGTEDFKKGADVN